MGSRSISPRSYKRRACGKREKLIIECTADYDCVLEPNKQLYIPGLGLKRDMGMNIIDVRDIKDVAFWSANVCSAKAFL